MSPRQKKLFDAGVIAGITAVVAVCVTCAGIVWSASADWTGMDAQIRELRAADTELKSTDTDHETRLRAIETVVTQTHTIVQRIDARVMMIHP
jgi:hypothetical protein